MEAVYSRPITIVLAIIAGAMLVATLCYPFGYDQAVFTVGGDMILHGSIPYRDFLDTKQPLIFYLYATSIGVFGRQEWSVHRFDLFFQIGAAYYFYRILRRELSFEISLLAVSLTLILYAGSGFWMTCEAESFAILPSLLLVDVTVRAIHSNGSTRNLFWLGALAGVAAMLLFALKFTLVIGAAAAMGFIIFQHGLERKRKWNFVIGLASSTIALAFFCGFLLWETGALHPFVQSLGWLYRYASIGNNESLWEQLFLTFPERLVYSASFSLLALEVLGIYLYAKKKIRVFTGSLLTLLLWTGCAQLLGVLVERKIDFPYQYTRALCAFTPFMAIGLMAAFATIFHSWKNGRFPMRALWVVSVFCVLLLSPLVRIFSQTIPWVAIALSRNDASAEVQRRVPDYFAKEQQEAAKFLTPKMGANDQIFFWGNDVAIYFFSNKLPQTICLTATPFRSAATPIEWKTKLLSQLASSNPKYIIAEFGDARPYVTGSPMDSYQSLLAWREMESFLTAHYAMDTTIGHFVIFHLDQTRIKLGF